MQDGKYRVVLVSYILWNFLFFSPFHPQLLLQSGYLSSSVFLIYWPGIRSILMKWELAVMFPVSPSFSIYFIFRSSIWQDISGVTGKFGLGVQNETGQKLTRVLPRERTGYNRHLLPTTQEKTLHMDITRWSIPKSDWLCSLQPKMEKLYTVRKNKTGSWLWLRSWTPYCQIQT